MEDYKVYVHICPNGKRYYGSTKMDVERRWKDGRGYKRQKFNEAINEFGWDNIKHIIVAKGLTKNEALWLEEELTRDWKTSNPDKSYNIDYGSHPSEETRKKQSENIDREKISKANIGENNGMYGKYGKDNPSSKPILCLTTRRVFHSVKEGADYYGIYYVNITNCCRGRQKSAGKFNGEKLVWRYLYLETL